jgi:hypothetical protein
MTSSEMSRMDLLIYAHTHADIQQLAITVDEHAVDTACRTPVFEQASNCQ